MSVASSAEKLYLIGIEKIRFLYLSIRADQAPSPPRRQPCTRRVSGHARLSLRRAGSGRGAFGRSLTILTDIDSLDVPQNVRLENGGAKISDPVFSSHKDVGACQPNDRQLL